MTTATMTGKWVRYAASDGSERQGDVLERGQDADTHEDICYIVRWRLGSVENVPAERVTYCELPATKEAAHGADQEAARDGYGTDRDGA